MTPGAYLEKRRLMAGYSLTSLARELLMLTGFGTSRAESDFRRLRLTLISAEQDAIHHRADRIQLIRAFVPLDPGLYFELVSLAQQGITRHQRGLCRNCACSFWDRCELPVEPAAPLGVSTCTFGADGLCSACTESLGRVSPNHPTVAQQLRDLGERMARINREGVRADTHAQPPFLRVVPTTGEH